MIGTIPKLCSLLGERHVRNAHTRICIYEWMHIRIGARRVAEHRPAGLQLDESMARYIDGGQKNDAVFVCCPRSIPSFFICDIGQRSPPVFPIVLYFTSCRLQPKRLSDRSPTLLSPSSLFFPYFGETNASPGAAPCLPLSCDLSAFSLFCCICFSFSSRPFPGFRQEFFPPPTATVLSLPVIPALPALFKA